MQTVFVGINPEVIAHCHQRWRNWRHNTEVNAQVRTVIVCAYAVNTRLVVNTCFTAWFFIIQHHEVRTQPLRDVVRAIVVTVNVGVRIRHVTAVTCRETVQDTRGAEVIGHHAHLIATRCQIAEQVTPCRIRRGRGNGCTIGIFQFQLNTRNRWHFTVIRQTVVVGIDPNTVAHAVHRCFRHVETTVNTQIAARIGITIFGGFRTRCQQEGQGLHIATRDRAVAIGIGGISIHRRATLRRHIAIRCFHTHDILAFGQVAEQVFTGKISLQVVNRFASQICHRITVFIQ